MPPTPSNYVSIKITQVGLKTSFSCDLDFSSFLCTRIALLKIVRMLLAFLLHCTGKNPRIGMISTPMDVPEDAKEQLFVNSLLFVILLLPILSLWPQEYTSFLSGLSLFLMLLPGGRRFKDIEGLEKKVNAEKERKRKDGLYCNTLSIFHFFQRSERDLGKAKRP